MSGETGARCRGGMACSLASLVVLALAFCGAEMRAAEVVALAGRAMGTTWSAKFVPASGAVESRDVGARIAERLERIEQEFSTYRTDSELSRFNAMATTAGASALAWFPVSTELAQLAREARDVSEATGGAFDVTVDPLVRLWGFGPAGRRATVPTTAEISMARARVDWRVLEAQRAPPALRRLRAGITADFSSIGKGFAADAMGEVLARLGATNYFVQVGGDVRTGGRGPDGNGWRAGIELPTEEGATIARVVVLHGQALSTSGGYRNFFRQGGRRYSHIVDPRSGVAVGEGELASVAVVHASATQSSAFATALYVLGLEAGYRLAVDQHLAAVFFRRETDGRFMQQATPAFVELQQAAGSQ